MVYRECVCSIEYRLACALRVGRTPLEQFMRCQVWYCLDQRPITQHRRHVILHKPQLVLVLEHVADDGLGQHGLAARRLRRPRI